VRRVAGFRCPDAPQPPLIRPVLRSTELRTFDVHVRCPAVCGGEAWTQVSSEPPRFAAGYTPPNRGSHIRTSQARGDQPRPTWTMTCRINAASRSSNDFGVAVADGGVSADFTYVDLVGNRTRIPRRISSPMRVRLNTITSDAATSRPLGRPPPRSPRSMSKTSCERVGHARCLSPRLLLPTRNLYIALTALGRHAFPFKMRTTSNIEIPNARRLTAVGIDSSMCESTGTPARIR